MSDDLRRKLQFLEEDYLGQPLVAQHSDLREINQIRAQLGMPLVDGSLKEIGVAVNEVVAPSLPEATPKQKSDVKGLAEAREIYQAYLTKLKDLDVHRAYAEKVADATAGHGQTPVRPLATMGTGGGPLLCDHCGKPIVLEGGQFHGVTADVAWKQHPVDWCSWILGGMVVEIHTNGTLRIYHGYQGRNDSQCCNAASRAHEKALDEFQSGAGYEKRDLMLAFVKQEFTKLTSDEHLDLVNKILDTLYGYDPGIGINRPDGAGQTSGPSS